MKVTKVELNIPFSQHPTSKFKSWAKVTFDDTLLVTGLRLYEGENRNGILTRYIRFPDRQVPLYATGGESISVTVVNTFNDELRQHITDAISTAYDEHPYNPKNRKKK